MVGYSVDISTTGIRFLHDTELYPGESVTLWTSAQRLTCTVVRCRRLNPCCYEVGGTFLDDDPNFMLPEDVPNAEEQVSEVVREYLN